MSQSIAQHWRMLCVVTLLLFSGGVSLPRALSATSSCARSYTVQSGDTLSRIAHNAGTTVRELLALNRDKIWNPNLIHRGLRLCLPAEPGSEQKARPTVALEMNFQFEPTADEAGLLLNGQPLVTARGGVLGKRQTIPLDPIQPITAYSSTQALMTALQQSPNQPMVLGLRASQASNEYGLISIQTAALFNALTITLTPTLQLPECDAQSVLDIFRTATPPEVALTDATLDLLLESPDQIRYPFQILFLAQVADLTRSLTCGAQNRVGFALVQSAQPVAAQAPATAPQPSYRFLVVFNEEGLGPPGSSINTQCAAWRSKRGWYYRWLVNLFC